jgi:hypothetical protein
MFSKTFALFAAAACGVSAQAVFDWDCTNALGTCNNACFATNHGLANGVLTYDADASVRPQRREDAGCGSWSPCTTTGYSNWGDSCDEYPFASTHEGGTGSILRCVDSSENNSQGGSLSNFYGTINDGDQFQVVVRNYGGANFCDNAAAQNDGSEFHLVNGAHVDARRGAGPAFADAASPRTPTKFREYEDANGGRVLSLNPSENGTLVGQKVYDEGRWTEIVKEII